MTITRSQPAIRATGLRKSFGDKGDSAIIALAWCAAITLASYLWARKLDNRDPVR